MLQPRETDFLALLVVLVVLPLVIYILLGKWSEDTKRKERISLLAQLAAEEALRAESMAAASVAPLVPHSPSNNAIHVCARCSSPATTRCSQCKTVRYCSGKCQIIHWRHVHKHECRQLGTSSDSSHIAGPVEESMHELFSANGRMVSQCADDWTHTTSGSADSCISNDTPGVPMTEMRSIDRRVSRKSKLRRDEEIMSCSAEGASINSISCSNLSNRDASIKHKIKDVGSVSLDESPSKYNVNVPDDFNNVDSSNHWDVESDLLSARASFKTDNRSSKDQTVESNCNSSVIPTVRNIRSKIALNPSGAKVHKSHKSSMKMSREQPGSEMERKGKVVEVGGVKEITQGSNGSTSMGIMKMIGLRKPSKLARQEASEVNGQTHKKLKMLFPYDEFLKLFEYGVYDISPTGLINCGNSCYANAVLQCLTYTKPLTIYLLRRLHSRTCCTKNWCLMCELEQHVKMLRQSGGPSSPGRILTHMRHINRHMGDGSQEDAHEFLRLLVTSMQSICLEGLGGEKVVDPTVQETTFIQHTFGGSLKSKVKCLRCHRESERYENIMDLTLEIYGWVESLEDALTQFTTPEDLDGENMYRCGSCAAYVRARKQLSIREAPNILTIVLKRFQKGSYGKINKCITFPDMLDMVPFMTGTDDIPPLYMLYAVVVHLDMLNASFSGHYVSYVKDLQGNWYRIDDTEVQPVPMSQVMSEGAYILFYMRSCPRPARAASGKHSSKSHKSSRPGPSKTSENHRMMNRNGPPSTESYAESHSMEYFSDATSSDFSIFTSSDEASFTTESTRDSFSTVDYADACNDPIASIFSAPYGPDYSSRRTISCNMFSGSKPQTRFASEGKGFVMDSYLLNQPPVDRTTTSSASSRHCKV